MQVSTYPKVFCLENDSNFLQCSHMPKAHHCNDQWVHITAIDIAFLTSELLIDIGGRHNLPLHS